MSKYAEYMRSIDNNRTIYDFGEVGASVDNCFSQLCLTYLIK